MEENKKVEPKAKALEARGYYKSYDIKWLREYPEHPDYKLVAEYDKENICQNG